VGAWGATRSVDATEVDTATDRTHRRQYYEWRTYQANSATQQSRIKDYLQAAALPAWERQAVGPVGVFTEFGEQASTSVHVLLIFETAAQAATLRAGLQADPQYHEAAAQYLAATKDEPAFSRIESTLLVAFDGQPRLMVPNRAPRVLELRTYESHSEAKARRKIEMFNDGEIPIFREAGFETVFFGESLIGSGLPNLKYLLSASDMEANQAGWKAFVGHPDWKAMKDLPKYADTVSHIDKQFLIPTSFSQV
jgi:hypothetical protein